LKGIIIVVHVGAMKIYVGLVAMELLKKKKDNLKLRKPSKLTLSIMIFLFSWTQPPKAWWFVFKPHKWYSLILPMFRPRKQKVR
jgi:hypothetical protein